MLISNLQEKPLSAYHFQKEWKTRLCDMVFESKQKVLIWFSLCYCYFAGSGLCLFRLMYYLSLLTVNRQRQEGGRICQEGALKNHKWHIANYQIPFPFGSKVQQKQQKKGHGGMSLASTRDENELIYQCHFSKKYFDFCRPACLKMFGLQTGCGEIYCTHCWRNKKSLRSFSDTYSLLQLPDTDRQKEPGLIWSDPVLCIPTTQRRSRAPRCNLHLSAQVGRGGIKARRGGQIKGWH